MAADPEPTALTSRDHQVLVPRRVLVRGSCVLRPGVPSQDRVPLPGPRDQQEQFATDLLSGVRIRALVLAHQVLRDPCPRGPALQLRGQRQGGLPERRAVKHRRRGLLPGTSLAPRGPCPLLFPLDVVPVALDLLGAGEGDVPEHVRLAPHQPLKLSAQTCFHGGVWSDELEAAEQPRLARTMRTPSPAASRRNRCEAPVRSPTPHPVGLPSAD